MDNWIITPLISHSKMTLCICNKLTQTVIQTNMMRTRSEANPAMVRRTHLFRKCISLCEKILFMSFIYLCCCICYRSFLNTEGVFRFLSALLKLTDLTSDWAADIYLKPLLSHFTHSKAVIPKPEPELPVISATHGWLNLKQQLDLEFLLCCKENWFHFTFSFPLLSSVSGTKRHLKPLAEFGYLSCPIFLLVLSFTL